MVRGRMNYEKRGRSRKCAVPYGKPGFKSRAVDQVSHTKPHGPMGPDRIKLLAQKLLAKRAKESSGQEGD